MRFVDYQETNHVRIYQFADRPEWQSLSAEARCVYALFRMHVQQNGSIPIGFGGNPVLAVASLLNLDPEFVRIALEDLLEAEHLQWNQALGELKDPAHVAGEKATWSPAFRQQRARRRTASTVTRKRLLKRVNVAVFPSLKPRRNPEALREEKGTSPFAVTPRDETVTPRDRRASAFLPAVTPRDEIVTARDKNVTPRDANAPTVVVSGGGCLKNPSTTTTTEGALARAPARAAAPAEEVHRAFEQYREPLAEIVQLAWKRAPRFGEELTIRKWFEQGLDLGFVCDRLREELQMAERNGQIRLKLPLDSEDEPAANLGFFRKKIGIAWRRFQRLQTPVQPPPPPRLPSSKSAPLPVVETRQEVPSERWESLRERIRERLDDGAGEEEFRTWFGPVRCVADGPEGLVLEVPNEHFRHTLMDRRFRELLEMGGFGVRVVV